MRLLVALIACLAVACGGGAKQQPAEDDTLPDPGTASPGTGSDDQAEPPRSELQRRQDAACERVIPRLTECAVADARAKMSPEELAKLDLERTAPIHTRENLKKCKASELSSRQVRVYEVCDREETECAALVACLDNLHPKT